MHPKPLPTIFLCVLFYENYGIAKISCVCPKTFFPLPCLYQKKPYLCRLKFLYWKVGYTFNYV